MAQTSTKNEPTGPPPGEGNGASLDDFPSASERLFRELVGMLQARERSLAEREAQVRLRVTQLAQMLADYPEFRKLAHEYMAEKLGQGAPAWPADGDLEKWAREHGARPFDDVLNDLFPRGPSS
jgi:hypothetical protein